MSTEIKVKNFGLRSHMTLSNKGIRVDAGEIVWPDNILHGKTIVRQVVTPRRGEHGWGKGKASFFLDEKDSPEFDSIDDFVNHYSPKDNP